MTHELQLIDFSPRLKPGGEVNANKEKPLRVFPRWNTRRGNLAGLGVGRKACGHVCPRH